MALTFHPNPPCLSKGAGGIQALDSTCGARGRRPSKMKCHVSEAPGAGVFPGGASQAHTYPGLPCARKQPWLCLNRPRPRRCYSNRNTDNCGAAHANVTTGTSKNPTQLPVLTTQPQPPSSGAPRARAPSGRSDRARQESPWGARTGSRASARRSQGGQHRGPPRAGGACG